jgi:hypothetical protein
MQLNPITPRKAADNAFLQEAIGEADFERFRSHLLTLLDHAENASKQNESEEHFKNLLKPFLSGTNFGESHFINTKERQDLAIHNGKTATSPVGVIIEAKRPSNKAEMITTDDCNRKAFHEAIFYYLRERIENGNEDIKHIIITDVYRWFVFDAQDFERYFYESKKLKKWYDDWNQDQKVSSRTAFVYDHLAEFIGQLDISIKAACFEIKPYRPLLAKEKLTREEQKKLVPLFKFFTPVHLLKIPFASDNNELNKGFYRELLHILGLQEYKKKGTHYITRLDDGERHPASLIENTITQLESMSILSRLPHKYDYGETESEQLFNVAIQLLITWINRILFLKLLEAQLFKYHREDKRFRFLKYTQIEEYDELNKLFFQVLAVPLGERSERINKNFSHIPYLNSSLFDVADIEADAIYITALEDGLKMPVYNKSKIRGRDRKRLKGEELSALEYLLRFLDAYNFNTEGTAEVQKKPKTLINASVLGRIFEKINGYKDGSFFTPGYITEYMCRETIRRAVVQKFNDAFEDWDCKTIEDAGSKLARHEVPYEKANDIVNSTTICDPAVGSGHFLVSALNELIAVKHDLRIFVDEDNNRIRDVDISVDNDELRIAVGADPFFEYRVHHEWKENGDISRTVGSDTQRLQRALFREKNILIENCLFGVDINPNSVNICRLRLWIELLKHAYYKEAPEDTLNLGPSPSREKDVRQDRMRGNKDEGENFQTLEVLPNIDINIKQGNSLVSRFELDADLSSVFSGSKHSVDDYKQAVRNYKQTKDRDEKRRLQQYIDDVKDDYSTTLINNRPINEKLSKARGRLELMHNADLFGDKKVSKKEITTQEKEVKQLEETKAEEESGVFYNQAFEWRFEFPEVLDKDGNFTGFDAVIGNPPYVFARDNFSDSLKKYFYQNYDGLEYQINLYVLFLELTIKLLGQNGNYNLIVPNSFLMVSSTEKMRKFIFEKSTLNEIVNLIGESFEGVNVETVIIGGVKGKKVKNIKISVGSNGLISYSHSKKTEIILKSEELALNVYSDNETDELLEKIKKESVNLGDLVEIKAGLQAYEVGKGNPKQTRKDLNNRIYDFDSKVDKNTYPYLEGKDVNRYWIDEHSSYLKYGNNLAAPRTFDIFNSPKIIVREITSDHPHALMCCYSDDTVLFNRSNIAINKREGQEIDLKYVLGVLNSCLMSYYFKMDTAKAVRKMFPKIILRDLRKFPFKKNSKTEQEPFIKIVNQILTAKKENPEADTSGLEAEIDELVYELYGLSEEDIGIVEDSV